MIGMELTEDGNRIKMTIYRIDNMITDRDKNQTYCMAPVDCMWRQVVGWPDPLYLYFKDHNMEVLVPALPDSEVTEIVINNPGFSTAVPPTFREIPRKIFQFWHTDSYYDSPVCLQKAMMSFRYLNPGYEHYFFGLEKARQYIFVREGARALNAFDRLRPMAYKVDLWRLIAVYHEGGVYSDSKLNILKPLDMFLPSTGALVVDDRPPHGILNAFFAAPKNDPLLRTAIDMILNNVERRLYRSSPLAITGPVLVQEAYDHLSPAQKSRYVHYFFEGRGMFIWPRDAPYPVICVQNGEYRRVHMRSGLGNYSDMWRAGIVYALKTAFAAIGSASKDTSVMTIIVLLALGFLIYTLIKSRKRLGYP